MRHTTHTLGLKRTMAPALWATSSRHGRGALPSLFDHDPPRLRHAIAATTGIGSATCLCLPSLCIALRTHLRTLLLSRSRDLCLVHATKCVTRPQRLLFHPSNLVKANNNELLVIT